MHAEGCINGNAFFNIQAFLRDLFPIITNYILNRIRLKKLYLQRIITKYILNL